MKQTVKHFFKALFLNWRPILFFQVLFCTSSMILFCTAASWLTDFSLRFHSYSYLTAQNAVNFLLSPVTLLCLAILLFFLFLLIYFDSCILLSGLQASVGGFRISCSQLVFSGFRRGVCAFRLRLLSAGLPLLGLSFVMNFYFIYQLMFRINPYCTYIPIIFKTRISRLLLAAAMILTAVYSFLHLFDFAFLFLGNHPLKESKKLGRRLFLSHPFKICACFFAVTAGVGIFWHTLRRLCSLAVALAVSVFAARDLQTALTLTLDYYVTMITLAFTIVLGIIVYNQLIAFLFYRYSGYSAQKHVTIYRRLIPQHPARFLFPAAAVLVTTGIVFYFWIGIYRGTIRAERAAPFIQIAAHRGVSSEAPENTIPAVELSIEYLSDYVEIDVQCTEDGEVVVFHDTSLKRVTGSSRALADVTYNELLSLDAGYYFNDSSYLNTPVPTLAEVMETAKGRINLLIELKRNKSGDDLVEKVLSLIDEYDMEYQCMIQSADYQYLSEVYELNPDMTTGYILSNAVGNYYNNEKIDFFSVRSAFVTRSTVQNIHAAGKKIFAWTVNTQEELERMKRIQVDGIITDYPIRAREIIYRDNENQSLSGILTQIMK